MIKKRFKRDIYNRYLTLWYGTREEINRAIVRLNLSGCEPLGPTVMGRYVVIIEDNYPADYIMIVKAKWVGTEIASLAHECLHFVCYVLRRAGVVLTDESEEAFTYYLENTMKQCFEATGR